MFTGLFPSQHGANADHPVLDDRFVTLAEHLASADYRTWAWSANPHVGEVENLTQGFQQVEHPWQPAWRERALALAYAKAEASPRERRRAAKPWALKSAGDLAPEAFAQWLDTGASGERFFAFVNFMEGHRPFIPPRELRERHLPADRVEASYLADRDWRARWRHSFRIEAADPRDLELVSATYDVALRELDALFARLLDVLRERGALDRTIVVVVADHGEHLGEHHLVDHQYSLYEELLHVPLVVRAPGLVAPGRDGRPVSGIDLFPTLLGLLGDDRGVDPGVGFGDEAGPSSAIDLFAEEEVPADRVLVAEYPAVFARPFDWMVADHPSFDPGPWNRTLRALRSGSHKLIWGSDGRVELYDLSDDPSEASDLAGTEPERVDAMLETLGTWLSRYASPQRAPASEPAEAPREFTEEERRMLIGLGYAVDEP